MTPTCYTTLQISCIIHTFGFNVTIQNSKKRVKDVTFIL